MSDDYFDDYGCDVPPRPAALTIEVFFPLGGSFHDAARWCAERPVNWLSIGTRYEQNEKDFETGHAAHGFECKTEWDETLRRVAI